MLIRQFLGVVGYIYNMQASSRWRGYWPELPAIRGEFRVDVREHDDEVIVVADLPGIDKEDISLQLINPRALEVSCERKGEKEEKEKVFMAVGPQGPMDIRYP